MFPFKKQFLFHHKIFVSQDILDCITCVSHDYDSSNLSTKSDASLYIKCLIKGVLVLLRATQITGMGESNSVSL